MKRTVRVLTAAILCLTLLSIVVTGCTSGTTKEEGKELVVAIGTDVSTFDPHFTTDSATEVINKNLYNNLVRFNQDMELIPDLATNWELDPDDGVTWTFELRQGVKFHDGTDFNAEAVKACLERVVDKDTGSPRRSVLEMIESVEAVDEYTVKIVTGYPCGSFLRQLAHPVAAMISPTAIEKYGKDLARNPVGTGPLKLVEWSSGEKIVMEGNADYYDGAPKVDKVVFRIVPEDATRAMLIESGQADVVMRLPITELERLRSNQDLTFIETPTLMTMYVALNNQKGALADPRVRQAMNYAVDKELIIKDIVGDLAILADAPISPATWGHAEIGAYPYDPEKAKTLLEEAGYGDGLELELWTPVGRYLMDQQVSVNLQAQLAEVGIDMKIRQWEFQALMSEVKKGEFDMVLLGWSPSTGDADQGLFPVFESSQWPPGSNRAHYKNEQVDQWLKQAKVEVVPEERLALYQKIQQTVVDEAAWLFLYYPKQVVVCRSNVQGVEVLPTEHILLGQVKK